MFEALAGLDFSAIRVPSSGSSGSLSGNSGGLGGSVGSSGGSSVGTGQLQSPISIGANDDPAMVREAFYKNPDQLALVRNFQYDSNKFSQKILTNVLSIV